MILWSDDVWSRHTFKERWGEENEAFVPTIIIASTRKGQLKCTLRPPLDEKWDYMFKEAGAPRRVLRLHLNHVMYVICLYPQGSKI